MITATIIRANPTVLFNHEALLRKVSSIVTFSIMSVKMKWLILIVIIGINVSYIQSFKYTNSLIRNYNALYASKKDIDLKFSKVVKIESNSIHPIESRTLSQKPLDVLKRKVSRALMWSD